MPGRDAYLDGLLGAQIAGVASSINFLLNVDAIADLIRSR